MFKKKKNNKGFTLVELLVVIAIIGILAVVAVPSLFKNINKAKASEAVAYVSAAKTAATSAYADSPKETNFLSALNDVEDKPEGVEITSITIDPKDGKWTIEINVSNADIGDKLKKMSTDDTIIIPNVTKDLDTKE